VGILGFVPRRDLVLLYNIAACFVFPSLYESFGLAQLEAMACGCPVLASNSGALPEVAGDAAMFCDPHDPKSIGETIVKLVSDPTVRQVYVERGLARAKQFTWDRCAHETLEALKTVAVCAGARRGLRYGRSQDARHGLRPRARSQLPWSDHQEWDTRRGIGRRYGPRDARRVVTGGHRHGCCPS
jgi:hypothetical protein